MDLEALEAGAASPHGKGWQPPLPPPLQEDGLLAQISVRVPAGSAPGPVVGRMAVLTNSSRHLFSRMAPQQPRKPSRKSRPPMARRM